MDITIVDMRTLPAGDPKRIGKYDKAIVYRVESGEQYFTVLPAEDFTEDKLKAQVKKETEERGALLGKKITI
jgi:hypothetical protein